MTCTHLNAEIFKIMADRQDDSTPIDTCDHCGEDMDTDCQGEPRCPECDPPCYCCHDGGVSP